MHTYKFDVRGCDDAMVHANSDWSGETTVRWKLTGQDWTEVKVPGPVLQSLVLSLIGQMVEGRATRVIDNAINEIRDLLRPAVKKVDEFVNKKS